MMILFRCCSKCLPRKLREKLEDLDQLEEVWHYVNELSRGHGSQWRLRLDFPKKVWNLEEQPLHLLCRVVFFEARRVGPPLKSTATQRQSNRTTTPGVKVL